MNVSRVATVLLGALLVAATCTWVFSRNSGAHAAVRVPQHHCIAATKDLQPGEILQPQDFSLVATDLSMTGTFDKGDVLIGRSVLYPIEKGQPITEKLLSSPGAGMGLSGAIAEGMRAIALRSDEVMGVAGFLFPGSHVDVVVTYRTDASAESQTLTVLQNAEVLAAGQKTQPDPEGKPVTATVVTLLLSPEDAQKAVLASSQGAIHFLLRNGTDKGETNAPPVALSQLWNGKQTAPRARPSLLPQIPVAGLPMHAVTPAPLPAPRTPKHQIVVDTVTGDKVTTQTFGGGPRD